MGKRVEAPVHDSKIHGNQDKEKLEGRKKQEYICAGECICAGVDFTAEGTERTGVHSVSREERIQGDNSLSTASRLDAVTVHAPWWEGKHM